MRRDHANALAAYVGQAKRRNLSPLTVGRTRYVLRAFFAATKGPLAKVTTDDVRRFLAGREREGVVHDLSNLRVFFRCVLEDGPLPTDGLNAKRLDARPPLLLTKETVRALLVGALAPRAGRDRRLALRDRALLEILYGVGLRAAEVRAARIGDLDLAEGTLFVRRVKRAAWRALPLPKAAIPHLDAYVRDARPKLVRPGVSDGGHLFLSRGGRRLSPSDPGRVVARLSRVLGLRAHPHAFRRAVATHLVRDGVSELVVKELLGHASLSTTARYVVVDREDLHRAVATLDRSEKT